MLVTAELINGIAFGIEHISGEHDDEFSWIIAVHFLCFRFCFMKQ